MLSLHHAGVRLCDTLSRREWLRIGSLGTCGLSLPHLWTAHATAAASVSQRRKSSAKSVLVLFMMGGPPHQETWDPKPNAPEEVRGPLGTIATATPGVRANELMPLTAKLTQHIAVLRAMSTNDNAHSSSGYWMLTGVPHQPTNSENSKPGAPNDWPCLGAIVQWLNRGSSLPAAITLPQRIFNTGGIVWPGQDGGFLGRSADPWLFHCEPASPDFHIPELRPLPELPPVRIRERQSLRQQLDQHFAQLERQGIPARFTAQTQQAFDLLTSAKAREAFDLDREPARVRDRYGRTQFGQSCLLARRLIEAGTTLVQVNWYRAASEPDDAPVWDTHVRHVERMKTVLMPVMDQAYSALIEDLAQRGLLDETLVVWAGEFGRTPRFNGRGGRDHWGHVFSVALAGGGVRGGMVYGESDKIAAYPKDGRVQPEDLHATIYHCLGYSPDTEMRDTLDRPLPISRGQVIQAVLR